MKSWHHKEHSPHHHLYVQYWFSDMYHLDYISHVSIPWQWKLRLWYISIKLYVYKPNCILIQCKVDVYITQSTKAYEFNPLYIMCLCTLIIQKDRGNLLLLKFLWHVTRDANQRMHSSPAINLGINCNSFKLNVFVILIWEAYAFHATKVLTNNHNMIMVRER